MKKLVEGLQYYRDKLHEETVFKHFAEILTKARSNKSANKPDTELNEFESVGTPFVVVVSRGWRRVAHRRDRFSRNIDGRARKIRRLRSVSRGRRRLRRRRRRGGVSTLLPPAYDRDRDRLTLASAFTAARKKAQPQPEPEVERESAAASAPRRRGQTREAAEDDDDDDMYV